MKEITGDLWDYYRRPMHTICITTNGTIKKNGKAVMGRGCGNGQLTWEEVRPLLEGLPDNVLVISKEQL